MTPNHAYVIEVRIMGMVVKDATWSPPLPPDAGIRLSEGLCPKHGTRLTRQEDWGRCDECMCEYRFVEAEPEE